MYVLHRLLRRDELLGALHAFDCFRNFALPLQLHRRLLQRVDFRAVPLLQLHHAGRELLSTNRYNGRRHAGFFFQAQQRALEPHGRLAKVAHVHERAPNGQGAFQRQPVLRPKQPLTHVPRALHFRQRFVPPLQFAQHSRAVVDGGGQQLVFVAKHFRL